VKPSRTGPLLAGVGIAAALLFFVALGANLPWLRLATKPLPALVLAAWVALRCRAPLGRLTAGGLVLSALGDLLLECGLFLPGLLAFLAAHVAYVLAFLSAERRPALGSALPFFAWGLGAFSILRPRLGPMTVPVAVYVAVISTMMWRAAARLGSAGMPRRAAFVGLAGAVAFGASDTLIAFDRFAQPMPGMRFPIMILYWLGQWGIAASVVGACGMLPEQVNPR
jgi:alkenylglycerophosphocholine/alkenylglycerophosphoethanolamine hydrolase